MLQFVLLPEICRILGEYNVQEGRKTGRKAEMILIVE
jgi:hypothetical protein